MKLLPLFALASMFALGPAAIVRAQEPAPPAKPPMSPAAFKVAVALSRSQGERKISNLPYTLSVTGSHASLRLGTKIPAMAGSAAAGADGKPSPQGPYQYQDVGTNIDCDVKTLEEGRFMVILTIDDSSVYVDEQAPGSARSNPSFRSFRASNSVVLRDGQTGQLTSATDKLTGETVKVDVTLTVVK